jgi:hypothetical protein
MDTNQQINALVERFGLSETVKQEIVKILHKACDDAYELGYSVALDKLSE